MADNASFYGRVFIGLASLLIVMFCLMPGSVLAAVSAHIDRDTINEGETFTLTLKVTGSVDGQLDVSPLQKDFEVLSTGQQSEVQIINGSVESRRSWTITLSPRLAGTLVIPPIAFGNDSSAALSITVLPATASSDSGQDRGDVFIEVNARPEQVHVQAQLLYTVRLYYAVPLHQGSLSEPALDNAIVEKLGDDSKFETRRAGRDYQVIERRYAIFPQRSGALALPEIVFDGVVSDSSRRSGNPFFDRFNQATRQVRLRSRTPDIQVNAQPASYTGTHWLPAQELTLEEKWSPEQPKFRVGEPVTRTVTMHAKGLSASQLPDIPPSSQPGLKLYPDQAQTRNSPSGDALVSEREQKIAMIPTQAGSLSLPAIRVDWWDTSAGIQRSAQLPARTIQVLPALVSGAVPGESPVPATPEIDPQAKPGQSASNNLALPNSVVAPETQNKSMGLFIWIGIALLFALAWLITMLLWWRSVKKSRVETGDAKSRDDVTVRIAAKNVTQACQRNDLQALKDALLIWARLRWPDDPLLSLGALSRRVEEGRFRSQITNLDQMLYQASPGSWDCNEFLQSFNDYRKQAGPRSSRMESDMLEPLHIRQTHL